MLMQERPGTSLKLSEEERFAKAYEPGNQALKLHPFYHGKIEVTPKCCIRNFEDFAIWYTPGVAEPCKEIQRNPEKALEHTNKWNMVAVVSDGTRVLGLGNIGPLAGLPVMEGKAILFKYLGGVDAFPLCIGAHNTEEVIQFVKWIQPTFAGVNLEDIEKPKCFTILNRLRQECEIPVWHDDQQGTAAVTVAGLLNALKIVNKKLEDARITIIGAGAAGLCIARMSSVAGVDPGKVILVDSKGILHKGRTDLQDHDPDKWYYCQITNAEGRTGDMATAIDGADVLIGLSRPGPGVIKKEWVSTMREDAIVFACANPTPEIWPWEAKEAGAKIVATGRSDFENQVNNSLGFPGIFRGTLDVMATTITDEMCIAAARELAKTAEDNGLREDYIIPRMDEWELFPREAVAVGLKAIEQGHARRKLSRDTLYEQAVTIIERSRKQTKVLMETALIKLP
jgi:malate dehydrogenase (oxaloacetate-decarboxylating)